jgi:hypothetical protein
MLHSVLHAVRDLVCATCGGIMGNHRPGCTG